MAKKLKEEQKAAVEQAETAAKETGTGNPVLAPETSNVPEPGTTAGQPYEVDVVNTDDAKSLQPNVTVSGTKPDGEGGQVLLDTVDPSVANAALIPDTAPPEPKSPAKAPEQSGPKPAEGEVLFRVTADNEPYYSGGPLKKGNSYVMSREEAELLTSLNAGQIETGSDSNAKIEGSEAE